MNSSSVTSPVPPERDRLVSVIVAACNAEAHLEQTCRSALSQTHRAIELIIVDDGSTDSTGAIAKRLAAEDPRVRLISQPNGGVAAARNTGIAAARGTFIAPLDADDLWDTTKIARQVRRFDECGPRTGVVYAWWVWIDADGRTIDSSPRWRVEGRVLERLIEVNFTGCASVPLFRRSTLDEVGGYDASLRARNSQGCEDWDLVLRVAEHYEVAVAPAVLVGYRRHGGSMSTATDTMWRSQVAVTDAVASRQAIPSDVMRRSRGQFALHLAGVAFWSGDYVRAVQWGLRARPLGLTAAVAPHVLKMLVRRFPGPPAPGPLWPDDHAIADRAVPDPLIPYDRIYGAHWARGDVHGTGGSRWRAQAAGVVAALAFIAALNWNNDGLWFQGDAPRHAVTGLFYRDLIAAAPGSPLGYALSYYARYPVIVPGAYPPLFHLLEGLAFSVGGAFPVVAKAVVWMFAVMAGFYTMRWGRRWIAPWAGWAGALVLLLPAFVRFSNVVLLNVPATALGLGALFHLRVFVETGKRADARWCAVLAVGAVATYLPGAIVVPVAALWLLSPEARARVTALWKVGLGIGAAIALAAMVVPSHLVRHLPSPALLLRPEAWRFYADAIPGLVGPAWLGFGLIGLTIAMVVRPRRHEAVRLLLAAVAVVVTLLLLPAMDARYALLLAPITILAALLGLAALLDGRAQWHGPARATALAALVVFSGLTAAGTSLPRVSGIETVARYLVQHGTTDSVLYSGAYDGVFGFYARALDPGLQRRVVLSNKLLYRYALNRGFIWEETAFVSSAADVVAMLRDRSGCRWVALEVTPEEQLPASERLLRQAVRGPDFELAAAFDVTAGPVSRIELYRFKHPVAPVTAVDLQFPSFSDRVFTGVVPVPSKGP